MRNWPFRALGEVVEINPRLPRSVASSQSVSFIPMAAVDEVLGEISSGQVQEFSNVSKGYPTFVDGDVLFAKITPCMENGKAAIACDLENGIGAGSTEFFVLRPRKEVLPEYIFYFIRRPSFRAACRANFTGSAGQQRVPRSFLEMVSIALPPLDEQRRLVGLLRRAAEIRRRAEAARVKARTIIPALFLETFGDHANNPKGWQVHSLGEIADIGSGLTKGRKSYAKPTVSTPYLRVANVQADSLNLNEIKMIEATEDDRTRYRLLPGDLLMTEGGDIDKLGRCAIWNGEIDLCLHQNHLFRVRMREMISPQYARAFMQSDVARGYFLRVAKRTTGIASINKTQLSQLPVWVPPIGVQNDFVDEARRADAVANQLDRAAVKAEAIVHALSGEVFG